MSTSVGCPRCSGLVTRTGRGWICIEHGETEPLWRPSEVGYDAFAEHLRRSIGLPTYLPWPLGPGWAVTDFAAVGAEPERSRATMTCVSGSSSFDGPVDVVTLVEEPGTGLGARLAGTRHDDPGAELGEGAAGVRVRIGSQAVPMWPVSTSTTAGEWDRSVVVGEADGRWLWIVLRPASALLLLRDDWILRDASQTGPALVELPFGGPPPPWGTGA